MASFCLVGMLGQQFLAEVLSLSYEERQGYDELHVYVFWAFALTSVVLFLVRRRARRSDLEDRRYGLVATLLKRLWVDLDENAPVELKLDLSPCDEARKSVGKLKRGKWNCEDFTDPWLSLKGRFADGTHLHVSMVERLQKRKRFATVGRGKRRLKLKRKGKALLQVGLRVKPERFPGLSRLDASARRAVRLPAGVKLSRLDVAGDRVSMRALLDLDWVDRVASEPEAKKELNPLDPSGIRTSPAHDASRAATMMLLSLYQVLNFARSARHHGNKRALP
ncbi:hypothetical protein [Corallococcus terminator]|nr:hypothetical protein [Corallococcus terminator]